MTAIFFTNGPGSQGYIELPGLQIGTDGQMLTVERCMFCVNEIPTFTMVGGDREDVFVALPVRQQWADTPESSTVALMLFGWMFLLALLFRRERCQKTKM